MRITAFAGLFALLVIFAVNTPKANAEELSLLSQKTTVDTSMELAVTVVAKTTDTVNEQSELPVVHQVKSGETLTDVAKQHNTTWQRVFSKNTQLSNPDLLKPGDELVIPEADEELAARPVQVAVAKPQPKPTVSTSQPKATTARGSSSGNTYTYGYCTWYVKNRRPDLPNNLGNAISWVSRAAAQGLPTGSTPRVGAAGQKGNHVVYVEQVHADGTVTVSEMNHKGWAVTSSRRVPASYFQYIY